MDKAKREMSFEEEAKLYEEEARAEFAKETGCGDAEGVNNILRRGMRIIRKAREEIARQSLRPKGEWIEADDGDGIVCSFCAEDFCTIIHETDRFNFCPNCGADMRGERNV